MRREAAPSSGAYDAVEPVFPAPKCYNDLEGRSPVAGVGRYGSKGASEASADGRAGPTGVPA